MSWETELDHSHPTQRACKECGGRLPIHSSKALSSSCMHRSLTCPWLQARHIPVSSKAVMRSLDRLSAHVMSSVLIANHRHQSDLAIRRIPPLVINFA